MRGTKALFSLFSTEMGWMGLVTTAVGVYASVLPQSSQIEAESRLLSGLPFRAEPAGNSLRELEEQVQTYLRGNCRPFSCAIDWSWSTPFQRRVLEQVQAIPIGQCLSYGETARMAGSPGGARAVGRALSTNRIPVIIPCHRVIRQNGCIGGFTGAGLEVKARLLLLEGLDVPSSQIHG